MHGDSEDDATQPLSSPPASSSQNNGVILLVDSDGASVEMALLPNGGGRHYARKRSKDGWVAWYQPNGAKEKEHFEGKDGALWFTWFYLGDPGQERGIMKMYHEADPAHTNGTVEWYSGERGSECMYCKYDPKKEEKKEKACIGWQ